MNETKLWAIHLTGPDEIHAAPSREAAEKRRDALNDFAERHGYSGDTQVIEWLWTAERHAEDLKRWNDKSR